MKETIISNITMKDVAKKQIRILAHQKCLFAEERPGFPATYEITVLWKSKAYNCTYRIGSKDGKARSGVLRLKDGLGELVGNISGKALGLKRIEKNKYQLTLLG